MEWPEVPAAFRLGVLMLDTRFPRPVGDIGNPDTFPFDVVYHTVPSALVEAVVTDEELPEPLTAAFLAGARELVGSGAGLITTSCGFLSVLQGRLQEEVEVPVVASALNLLPELTASRCAEDLIGVLTFDGTKLTERHLPKVSCEVRVEGVETGAEIHRVVANDEPALDPCRAEADAIEAAERLCERAPGIAAIVLECTNLAPYRDAIERVSGVPVVDIRHAIVANLHF